MDVRKAVWDSSWRTAKVIHSSSVSMEQSAVSNPGTAQPEVSQCKDLDHRTGTSEETNSSVPSRGESEAPQDELTNLGGTKVEQRVKYVEDKLREMNARFEGAEKRLEVLQERLSQEAASETDCCGSRSQEASNNSQCFAIQNPGLESVLANAMRSHKFSEYLNDPCQEADALEMYNGLRTHEWEKAKCAASGSAFPMTYEKVLCVKRSGDPELTVVSCPAGPMECHEDQPNGAAQSWHSEEQVQFLVAISHSN
ncbi:uncharacterized protein LOC120373549 isoform X3 [Mauremys reevesii]|uniref:uncharacterized protein LOC120373549 isoform X3 n=1 Tax=Mauremys reevesii TaxID=260615 RepID=UPI00193FD545|nr:uncharacterized protein LOC120373549 isoform X3 [Mauremys reevesii]